MLMPTYLLANEFSAFESELRHLTKDVIRYKRGETIIFPGDKRPWHFYVADGVASYSFTHISGRNKIVTFRGAGTIFPFYYDYDSVIMEELMEFRAFSDMTVWRIDHKQIKKLVESNMQLQRP